ncbi:unnamed protein product [Penicillium salamii]|uniref:DUF7580 domain-containing protein n=1 Tax=Penicillium salamii TaxID=1612424 RepID=A0A9W4NSC2_9EURO|nr:unnamed protein product [Penicillium salamii]CAG8395507.1 unnamed protein product [Penicillium salamii]CAG8414677.1 unnamed protein product [Penicillium salamii]CAG8419918.1 unnamed protein product [Penicillium salamii]
MATGFEAAGLALAIFPILIEVVKFYANEKNVVKDFVHYQKLLKRIGRDLSCEKVLFRNSCQRFMQDIASHCGIEEDEVNEILNDQNHPRWSDRTIDHVSITSRASVQLYLDIFEDMMEELSKINDLLGIKNGENPQPELLDKKTRRRQWKKIVLVLKADGIAAHLQRTSKLNADLALLTQQHQYIITTGRVARKNTKQYQWIRSHAIDLYDILQSTFPATPNCNCPLRHDVNLNLEFRSAKIAVQRLSFRTIFTAESPLFALQNWCEIEIEPLEKNSITHCRDPGRPVQINIAPSSSSENISQVQPVLDLCNSIRDTVYSKRCLGLIGNSPEKQHRIWTTNNPLKPAFHTIHTISLAEVLKNTKFRQEQRARLGLKLASSVMQLHTTQWLTDIWSNTDISFACSIDGTVDFNNPFIRRTFGSQSCDTIFSGKRFSRPYLVSSVPCLYSLGIVLLELWYGNIIDNMKNQDERHMPAQFSDPVCAQRLTKEMDCSPNYKNAVLRCICGLDAVYTSLEEDAFRDEVEEKIIGPLEEDLKYFCDKQSIDQCF